MTNLQIINVQDSKAIQTIMFDKSKSQLLIKFANSPLYTYENVHEAIFQAFAEAPSKGSFYHKHIKTAFEYTQRLDN